MKIVYLLKSFAAKGGEERVMADKMNYLAEHGHEITLITSEQGQHELVFPLHHSINHVDLDTRFFTITNLPLLKKLHSLHLMRKIYVRRLTAILNELRPDIMTSTIIPLKNIRLTTRACKATGIPLILESHLAFKATIKQNDFSKKSAKWYLAKFYDIWNLRPLRHCSQLVALTKGDADNWRRYCKNVIVIPNPVTHIPDQIDDVEKIPSRIIAVGRLHAQKGFDLLIEAFSLIASKIPNWYIDIYGQGIDRDLLRDLIDKKGLIGRVNLKGVSNSIYDEYKKSQFLVLSSRYEGFGLVLIEAMSCGIPCAAFRCEYGPEDIISDGSDGLLIKDGDIKELARKILWLATHSQDCAKMGSEARKKALLFNMDAIMKRWIELFNAQYYHHYPHND